ncbi:MAG TPA: hypothetical protein VFH78_11460 [Candidatus Thermoplasmatota archaeon]|nr:hypothetical protein [Candidatus Thermoplasmatota archaeon]
MAASRLQRLRREGLSESFPFAGPAFRRAAPWLLAAVFLLGLLTRLHPAVRYGVWGSDSGEYYFLTKQLVETGRVLFDYDGWGLAYPYFPGMFALSGAVHAVMGVDLFYAVQWTTPFVAALIGVLTGLLAYRVTSDPRAGVLAGAFVAATAAVVLTTSHAMPGSLGQVLLVAMLALLPDTYRDRWNLVPQAILGAALLLTHHLSTYFAIGILAFIPFYREMTQRHFDWPRLRIELPLVGALLLASLVWWLAVADPFREEIVGDALPFPPAVTVILFLLALAALPALVVLRRSRSEWHLDPRYASFPRQRAYILGGFLGFCSIIVGVILFKLPGSDIDIGWITLFYAVPLLAWLAFLPLGVGSIRFHRYGSMLVAWLYALSASLVFAIAINSKVLFPFRHVDYIVTAMAPLVAVGMLMVYDQAVASRVPGERASVRTNAILAVVGLIAASAVLSLPPRETIGGFEEGISVAELSAVRWARDNLPPNSTIAGDHRLSSLLFGLAGMHPTWDYTPVTYHAETPEEALEELAAARVPPRDGNARIDYVILSPEIEAGVTLLQWETSRPMSPAAIAKFEDERYFEKVYDEDGVRIYRVRWDAVAPDAAPLA